MRRSFIKGFTLAEVLITLTIIGVIAALTIPSLLQNIQDAQLKVSAKKAYSTIEQATRTIMMNNGGTMIGYASSHATARDAYLQYMPSIKKCHSSANSSDPSIYCGDNYCNYFASIPYGSTGYMGSCIGSGGAFAVLNNGMFFLVQAGGGMGDPVTCNTFCSRIVVDVNGFNGPNQSNKDIFDLFVMSDRLIPDASLAAYLKQ